MGDDARPKGPFVLNIRMSGRLVPFAAGLTLFAVLPFLGGSTPAPARADVVLAAGSPAEAAVQDAVGVVDAARQGLSGRGTGALLGDAVAVGGGNAAFTGASGLYMFPSIALGPMSALTTALSAPAVATPITGAPVTAGFIHPVAGGEASSFGPRIHPVLGRAMFHTGIDLMAACGTPIRAAADGTVIYARVSNSWGLRTIIEHTSGIKTAYGHQSKFLVAEGATVKQGQVIGLVGTTGWSTGCHLHFDVIINERYVDPAPYLGFAPSNADSIPYAVVPHLVLDQGGRTVRTVEDGDVPIPSRGTSGSTSSVDGPGSTPTTPSSTPTTTRPTTSGTTTTKPPTSTGTSTTKPPTSTGTSSGTPTGTGTTTTNPPTTTTNPPATTTNPPATTTNPPPRRRTRLPRRRPAGPTTTRRPDDDEPAPDDVRRPDDDGLFARLHGPVDDERRAVDRHVIRGGAGGLERGEE